MKGYCIYCGAEVDHVNINEPYCILCGSTCSSCNRSSFTDKTPMFCHICGNATYVMEEDPICDDCKKELKTICQQLR